MASVFTHRFAATLAAALIVLCVIVQPLRSHPHVLVDAQTVVLFDDQGAISGLRHAWTFDLLFSTYAVEGLDADNDGVYSQAELEPLAEVNVTSLGEFDFFSFTYATVGGDRPPPFTDPIDYRLDRAADGRLTLHFTLPYQTPIQLDDAEIEIDVYDPEYFVAFSMVETEPVALRNAPEACRFVFRQPQELDPSTAMTLSQIPAEVRDLPPELLGLTQGLANTIVVRCGDVPVEDEAEVTEVNAPTPSASPFGVGPAPQPTINSGGPLAGYFAWVAGQQAQLYRWMADTVEQVRNAPGAGLILLFASFLYGVVHAAGPGHGKVVIGAYALATRQTARRAAIIALAAAFAQAVTAIVLIGMATGVFRAASSTVTTAAGWLELASYALIMGLGLWLSLRAVRRWMITKTSQDIGPEASPGIGPERSRQPASLSAAAAQSMVTGTQGEAGAGPADGKLSPDHADHAHAHEHAHHDHDHDHDCGDPSCGHSHLPKAKTLQGDFSLSKAVAAVLSVGIRPCSGALIVLVFCFAQGFYVLGILAVLAIAMGTALTTMAVALTVVGSGSLIERLSGSARMGRVAQVLQFVGGLVIVAFGTSLFAGTLVRMGLFA